jgi:hypothetical protein
MADAIVTDVIQEVSRILTASDVVLEELRIFIQKYGPTREDGTRGDIILQIEYHECKADPSQGRLEEPQVDGDVEREWSLSRGDDLNELLSVVVESTNVMAIALYSKSRPYTHDVIEQFLQGLCTNHTIVRARFHLISPRNTMIDVLHKSADMLCHNTGLKSFSLHLPNIKSRKKHSGFGKALKMNRTLQHLLLYLFDTSVELDLEELVQPLIMDENGHEANSTLTTIDVTGLSTMGSVGATFAGMLRKKSSIKHLNLANFLRIESDVQELIRSLVENHSLETLDLGGCDGVKGSVCHAILDVLLVNFTLKDIILCQTPLYREGKHFPIKPQL